MSAPAALTVAVSGPPGAGKTTLARALAQKLGATRLFHYDDYDTITGWPAAALQAWMARGSDPNEIHLDRLIHDLKAARADAGDSGVVVLETPFGRGHHATGSLIDLAVRIAVPLDVALARQIAAQAALARISSDAGAPRSFLLWLSGHLGGYEPFMRGLYEKQETMLRAHCDVDVDGMLPPDRLVDIVAGEIAARRRA